MNLTDFLNSARFTLREPRRAARMILDLRLPLSVWWTAMVLISVLSTLLLSLDLSLMPPPDDVAAAVPTMGPLVLAALVIGVQALGAYLMAKVGQWAGGRGQFDEALRLTVWMQAVLMVVQVAQVLAMATLPLLADVVGFVGLGLSMWLMVNFVAELHGFRSLFKVFAGIIAVSFAMVIALSVVLAVLFGSGI